jgi:hypothetical protein
MAQEHFSHPCFLCEAPSVFYEFDGGKRRHYRCSGSECGEYVVTDTVRRRIGAPHAKSWRLQVAALAKRLSNEQKILELWVNPQTKVLETHLVPISTGQPRLLGA